MAFLSRLGNQIAPMQDLPETAARRVGPPAAAQPAERARSRRLPDAAARRDAPMGWPSPPAWPSPVGQETSGLARRPLVLALLGFMCIPVLGPINGLVLGFSAKAQIKKSEGRLGGGGMATAGIVLSIVAIVVAVVAGGLIYWAVKAIIEPIDRTNEFIAAVNAGDVDAAYDLLAPGTVTRSELAGFVKEHKGSAGKYRAYSSSIEGDRAKVTVTFTDRDGYEHDEEFRLRKIDGRWKITYAPDW